MTTPPEGWPGERPGQVWLTADLFGNQTVWPRRGPWVQSNHCPDHRTKGGKRLLRSERLNLRCFIVCSVLPERLVSQGSA